MESSPVAYSLKRRLRFGIIPNRESCSVTRDRSFVFRQFIGNLPPEPFKDSFGKLATDLRLQMLLTPTADRLLAELCPYAVEPLVEFSLRNAATPP